MKSLLWKSPGRSDVTGPISGLTNHRQGECAYYLPNGPTRSCTSQKHQHRRPAPQAPGSIVFFGHATTVSQSHERTLCPPHNNCLPRNVRHAIRALYPDRQCAQSLNLGKRSCMRPPWILLGYFGCGYKKNHRRPAFPKEANGGTPVPQPANVGQEKHHKSKLRCRGCTDDHRERRFI